MESWIELEKSQPSTDGEEREEDRKAKLFDELITTHGVSFRESTQNDVFDFINIAYSPAELERVTRAGRASFFFSALHANWKPSFCDWAGLLWRFTGKTHEFFADLLYLMPSEQLPRRKEVGSVLFRNMLDEGLYNERTLASIAGALIRWPMEATMAVVHAKDVLSYSEELTPGDIGRLCRNLIRYRATSGCTCGYKRGTQYCNCRRTSDWNSRGPHRGEYLDWDMDKDYACALFREVIAGYGPERAAYGAVWETGQKDEFVRSASEHVFSNLVYIEIFQNVTVSDREPPDQLHVRTYSAKEREYHRANPRVAREYDRDFSQHADCVARTCRQHYKYGCDNVCCGKHCKSIGRRSCRVHRHYRPQWPPSYRPRKNIDCNEGEWIINGAL